MTSGHDPAAVLEAPRARWPWQRSLQARIVLSFGAVFLVALLLLLALLGRVVYQAEITAAADTLEVDAFLVANALEDPLSGFNAEFQKFASYEEQHEASGHSDDDNHAVIVIPQSGRLQQVADLYGSDTGTRVTILTPQGGVIADSVGPPTAISNQRVQVEVQAALTGLGGHDIRSDPTSGEPILHAAAPIQQGTKLLGVVQLARPLQVTLDRVRGTLLSFALAGLAAMVVAGLLAVLLSRRLLRPIRGLENASLAIARGDLDRRVPVESADEIGELAGAFNSMAQQVQTTMEQQRQFVANASHELRTPVTNIKLRSEALLGGGVTDTARAKRYLVEIDSEADRLGRLAATLLDLSRLESGAAEHETPRELVPLASLLLLVGDDLRMRAESAGLTLHVDAPADLPTVMIWTDQIEAALINLVDNAIKFTPAGGTIELAGRQAGDSCRITVSDTGAGIPPDDLPRVFDRFYRVDKAHSRQTSRTPLGSGAGLGLSIVRTLIEQNDGHIEVASIPGHGTTFTIELPVAVQAGKN
ncbi:MAG: cell wall metabolism sensor histidine kinase WalK [Anaerolineae bacterium]|nr:cell wall metabolism sensor histidine kinase WalK [Anaerolineae bacterium]